MWKRDFVNCLEGSTLGHPRIEEALAIKQEHLPRHIYKYRRDCRNSRNNLTTDTVWLSSPESYNDPYDCLFTLSDDHVLTALKNALVDDFVRTNKLQDVVSREQIESAKKSQDPLKTIAERIPGLRSSAKSGNRSSTVTPQLLNDAVSFLRNLRKLTKVCSFSEINNSLLMWSHYADNHKGVCLEYDLDGLKPDHLFRKCLYPVLYSSQLYDLTPFAVKLFAPDRQDFNHIHPLLAVLHKFDGWEYEQEWRVVSITEAVTEDDNRRVPTPSRIFLGSKMEPTKSRELSAICQQKKIAVYQMRLADDRFELLSEPFCG